MNMPPECVAKDSVDYFGSCCKYGEGVWTVFNKTKCEHTTVCDSHLDQVLDHGDTYVIYPAKDYSVHGGHDLPATARVLAKEVEIKLSKIEIYDASGWPNRAGNRVMYRDYLAHRRLLETEIQRLKLDLEKERIRSGTFSAVLHERASKELVRPILHYKARDPNDGRLYLIELRPTDHDTYDIVWIKELDHEENE